MFNIVVLAINVLVMLFLTISVTLLVFKLLTPVNQTWIRVQRDITNVCIVLVSASLTLYVISFLLRLVSGTL